MGKALTAWQKMRIRVHLEAQTNPQYLATIIPTSYSNIMHIRSNLQRYGSPDPPPSDTRGPPLKLSSEMVEVGSNSFLLIIYYLQIFRP